MYENETIDSGKYVIFQRKDYKKLHLLSDKITSVFIGKDKIELGGVMGKQLGSVFKMIPKKGHNRHFTLQLCSFNDMISAGTFCKNIGVTSGADNRDICDDGSSQSLTSDSIEELRDSGTAPQAIIEQLVENSKTFQIKTEYSQEKYIKKKEKKYYEFISVCSPNIRSLAEIFYNRDLPKSIGIRIDTLSQIITSLNLQSCGKYLLVENGFSGIVCATLLNSLPDNGKIIHVTPGNQNQKQAVLAMNFSSLKLSNLITVRLSTLNELMKKSHGNDVQPKDCSRSNLKCESLVNGSDLPSCENQHPDVTVISIDDNDTGSKKDSSTSELRKRKYSNVESTSPDKTPKKPRWAIEAELAVQLLSNQMDGLIIACKEFPTNITSQLLSYLSPSRPFVIYSLYQEPLVSLYVKLKQRHDIIYLRIHETWFRPYQVLPDRSHPAVTVSSSGGYLLSGIKVVNN